MVYANPAEEKEIAQHIRFLTDLGWLENDPERLYLDDLPDVSGLKALRVGVNQSTSARNASMVIQLHSDLAVSGG